MCHCGSLPVRRPWMWKSAALLLVLLTAQARVQDNASSSFPTCPPPPANCTIGEKGIPGEYFFKVTGHTIRINFRDGTYFILTCENPLSLEDPGLPQFESAVQVLKVAFKKCPVPSNTPYVAVLAALNVAGFSELELTNLPTAVVTPVHLAGLQKLTRFELFGNAAANVSLAPGALSTLASAPKLAVLELNTVRTPAADLTHLPPSLKILDLRYVGVAHIYFNPLPKLFRLNVMEEYNITLNVSNIPELKQLFVESLETVMLEDALSPVLTKLIVVGWNNMQPILKMQCKALETLKLSGGIYQTTRMSLPDNWVANCSELTELIVQNLPINATLPAKLLARALTLKHLTFNRCGLQNLPSELLATPRLTSLDLSHNRLTSLPSGLFMNTPLLETLNLSFNRFTNSVADKLFAATSLKILHLNDNELMDDLCTGSESKISASAGPSSLESLTSLTELYLSNTNVRTVCRDWRQELLELTILDLSYTNITVLEWEELQFWRARPDAVVYLKGEKFELSHSYAGYNTTDTSHGPALAGVLVDGSIKWDCNAYWMVMEYNKSSNLTPNITFASYHGLTLDKVDVDTLTCNTTEECKSLALPANCSCGWREDLDYKKLVFVECAGAGLTALPVLPPDPRHKWRLHLANNNISHVAAAHVAHIKDILELDLRNNLIKSVDGDTALNMASVPLRLDGNKLNCGCESLAMLTALVGPKSQLRDKVNVTCSNGLSLTTAPLKPCDTLVGVVAAALAVLMVAGVAVSIVLARPSTLKCVKAILVELGWIPRPLDTADDARRFDAFVSYAHEDEELVVEELAARLESGARPYRLCLHYRDWAPGEWIPAQIAASVRASRRTLAIVSRHYLESGWARAEFREATAASLRDATPRLVVVLLEDPDGLVLDPELDAYVRNNTYVLWRDPRFWEKLEMALPPPHLRLHKKVPSPPDRAPDILLQHKCSPVENASPPAPTPHPACDTLCSARVHSVDTTAV